MISILGLSAYYHDSAAALVIDGRIAAAAQEERFTRVKHDERYPAHAVEFCLGRAGLSPADLDAVVFYEKPLVKFDRIADTFFDMAPRGLGNFLYGIPLWATQRLRIRKEIRERLGEDFRGKVLFTEHHRSHAASAFFPSPFEEAAILTIDGVGEWATTTIGRGRGHHVELLEEICFPHSLGMLYSAFTYYCGFKVNSGEYKLMGLAPYGRPTYADTIREHLIELGPDGAFRLNMKYFLYTRGLRMISPAFEALFGGPARPPESEVTQREMDLAASIQQVTEEAMLGLARHARERTGSAYLCMAGGVALNCVANGKILREGIFDRIWIQPAAGDAGGALGAALEIWHEFYRKERRVEAEGDSMQGSLLGPAWTDEEVRQSLDAMNAKYTVLEEGALPGRVAELIEAGKVVGWFQGRMEFGPRALGARSILGDPRNPSMQRQLNLKIKFRESFRPFAPVVLAEHAGEYFDLKGESPYMLIVADVSEKQRTPIEDNGAFGIDRLNQVRSTVPAITHVDYSARVQTVDAKRHGLLHKLLSAFYERTGCPVLVNTSFNIRGEPIVCLPEEAYRCFMYTDMDALVVGRQLMLKEDQPPLEGAEAYRSQFKLD